MRRARKSSGEDATAAAGATSGRPAEARPRRLDASAATPTTRATTERMDGVFMTFVRGNDAINESLGSRALEARHAVSLCPQATPRSSGPESYPSAPEHSPKLKPGAASTWTPAPGAPKTDRSPTWSRGAPAGRGAPAQRSAPAEHTPHIPHPPEPRPKQPHRPYSRHTPPRLSPCGAVRGFEVLQPRQRLGQKQRGSNPTPAT